jgi:hypothetical protein
MRINDQFQVEIRDLRFNNVPKSKSENPRLSQSSGTLFFRKSLTFLAVLFVLIRARIYINVFTSKNTPTTQSKNAPAYPQAEEPDS